MPGKLITIRDVCDRYGLSDKTIRRKIKTGQLTAYLVGERLIKLDAEQVEAALLRPANGNNVEFESYITKVLAKAPPLTQEQVDRLRVLLEPARRDLANTRPGGGDAA
ncbi:MAG: helix-turn-helix domain-containing protein [Mycobacterium sp.]|nr:helix-turn-helix domain-containing protein [Mycobacterium sp.]HKI43099.1 helix-turn-helix domain-containing protein [Mycobacterium sp.]